MYIEPATAGVQRGDIFVHYEANGSGDGPMTRPVNFWEVTDLTAKRVWAARMMTKTLRLIPDSDGVFYGGRSIAPIPGKHFKGTRSLMRISIDARGVPELHLPGRRYVWISTAQPWDGSPEFTHTN